MVKAAYSAGKPALGVGAGNSPAYIERTADIKQAVSNIMASKTFDYGTICASEQSIVVEECNKDAVVAELKSQGAYFMTPEETEKVCALSRRDENSKSSGQTYTYIETDFIKALKYGYVIEIQEPTTIVQPGVLPGLNSLLEQTGTITLPTGEVIKRHPDAVVVVTTNIEYEGCRGMNQSVIDRMSLVRDVELPTPEVMVQRAMSVTGATDEYQISQMVQVVNDLSEYCRKNSITDGSYGMRSLIDWIVSSEITGDVYESALYTIISKATTDEVDREALVSAVLEPIFTKRRRKAIA